MKSLNTNNANTMKNKSEPMKYRIKEHHPELATTMFTPLSYIFVDTANHSRMIAIVDMAGETFMRSIINPSVSPILLLPIFNPTLLPSELSLYRCDRDLNIKIRNYIDEKYNQKRDALLSYRAQYYALMFKQA